MTEQKLDLNSTQDRTIPNALSDEGRADSNGPVVIITHNQTDGEGLEIDG